MPSGRPFKPKQCLIAIGYALDMVRQNDEVKGVLIGGNEYKIILWRWWVMFF